MARKPKTSIFDPITGSVDPEKLTNAFSKVSDRFSDTKQLDKVLKIKDRFQEMVQWRRQSCPWYLRPVSMRTSTQDEDGEISTENGNLTGGSDYDWARRWSRDYSLWSMKSGKNTFDPDLPEVTSPIVFAPIQAARAQFQDANTSATFEPLPGVDKVKAKVAATWLENWENKINAQKTVKSPTFFDVLTFGTAITYNSRVIRKRKINKIISLDEKLQELGIDENDSNISAENYEIMREELKTKVSSNPLEYLTKEEIITDYDDFYVEKVPLQEFFIDPSALEINGVSNDARDCVWFKSVPIRQVLQEFENSDDPFVVKGNVSAQILKTSSDLGKYYDDLKVEKDLSSLLNFQGDDKAGDCVGLLRYYNKLEDKYIVIANDVILRDGPLPYNHKLLPFSKYVCIPLSDSFYGVGYATLLDNIQDRDELFQQLQDFTAAYNANLPGTYTSLSGEISETLKEVMESKKPLKAGQWIQIGEGDSVTRLPPIQLGVEMDRIRADLVERSIKITGINPLMNSLPTQNTAVRNNQQIQENSLLMNRMIINNWGAGYEDAISQGLHIVKQTEPYSYESIEEEITDESTNQSVKVMLKKYKEMPTKGFEIEDGKINESEEGGLVELKPDYTDYFDKLAVKVRIETSALASRQLQSQQLQDNLMLVMQVIGNPVFSENPMIIALLKNVLEKRDVPANILNKFNDEDSDASDELAGYQNQYILNGTFEPPISGMSANHIRKHAELAMELLAQRENLMTALEQSQPQVDELGNEIPDPMALEIQPQIDQLTQVIRSLQEHLKGDIQAKKDEGVSAITMMQQATQPPIQPEMPTQAPSPESEPEMPTDEGMPMSPIPEM